MNKNIKVIGEAAPYARDDLGILPSSVTFGKDQVDKIVVENGEMKIDYRDKGKIRQFKLLVDEMYKTTLEFF